MKWEVIVLLFNKSTPCLNDEIVAMPRLVTYRIVCQEPICNFLNNYRKVNNK